jgi:Ca2+-binding RTX toxin-like protein
LSGSAGSDWVVYSEVSPLGAGVIVNLTMLLADDAAGIDTLSGIENILTGDGADSLSGDAFGNMISAAAGNDSIFGDAGDDTLVGGAGADTMGGGAGDDLFFVLDAGDLVIETAGGGADTIITSVSMTMPDHVEALKIASDISGITLIGGAGNDMLIGSGLSNIFIGGAGDDVILAGNVTLADIFALFTI